mmetsp:Transcript_33353/g.33973  ORF Transcript_33353/g.33973 Transcript_33353/m.33973 type:complete len:268 (+) Transcript_33353:125-928(+)|eukprot:CAMPEP_0182427482 /NCGR_PEP_ID=MMETSP1167-20130531/17589_1 /TAXON_ID=2988 /ORGANISM="Mallomonas Sp, Strain CCMP3275" /LENGTH=267 /DNA_ID=CAMNT_0024609749 /DNA_START=123 /DNA_END=926 /DNA_ORIENTATION=+
MFQYQNVPLQQQGSEASSLGRNDGTIQIERLPDSEAADSSVCKRRSAIVAGAGLVLLSTVMFAVSFSGKKSVPVRVSPMSGEQSAILGSSSDGFLGGAHMDASYCKTSCTSPCSKFPSVYGELCCEWSHSAAGTTCALSVSETGICTCGTPSDSSPVDVPGSGGSPTGPVPAPKPVAGPAPSPQQGSGFHPWPTIGFHPWPTMGFHPFPTMAWLPFNPIEVPDGAKECKLHCDNPCGWSQNNGESRCCESSSSGCGMTTINGKCYCG